MYSKKRTERTVKREYSAGRLVSETYTEVTEVVQHEQPQYVPTEVAAAKWYQEQVPYYQRRVRF